MAYPSDLVRTKNWGTEILTDADLEGQFDLIINWVMAALDGSTGHAHTGGSNDGKVIDPTTLDASGGTNGDYLGKTADSVAWVTPPSSEFVTGMIIMWSGAIADIPTGWVLCDGDNSTPNLVDKFIVGAKEDDSGVAKTNLTGSLTQSGGNKDHTHTVSKDGWGRNTSDGTSGRLASAYLASGDVMSAGAITSNLTSGNPNTIPVPYYALAFIMKT